MKRGETTFESWRCSWWGRQPRAPAQASEAGKATAATSPVEADLPSCCATKTCQDLLKPQLGGNLRRLFKALTGLTLHVHWHEPMECHRADGPPVCCPAAVCRCEIQRRIPARCRLCLDECWRRAAEEAGQNRPFRGHCGAVNFWARLEVNGTQAVSLILHARARNGRPRPDSPEMRLPRTASGRPKEDSGAAFRRAEALLRLILRGLEASLEASFARQGLDHARLRLRNLEAEMTCLRRGSYARIPQVGEAPARSPAGSRRQHIVREMLDYMGAHYRRPLALGDVAGALGMNASYLSSLFSRTMGVTFHRYLEQLRLANAEALLRDSRVHVCDVACAVGYASPNHFRNVFKAFKGVSPSTWRQLHQPLSRPANPLNSQAGP